MTSSAIEHLGGYIVGGDYRTFAPEVWHELVRLYNPTSFVDVGCGTGATVWWWQDNAPSCISHGIEGHPDAVEMARKKAPVIIEHDFCIGPPTDSLLLPAYDIGWSAEFVEHVDEKHVPNFMDVFFRCSHAFITHALPGQGGHHHVNEQPASYWIDVFSRYGFKHDPELQSVLRSMVHPSTDNNRQGHYIQNSLLAFHKDV